MKSDVLLKQILNNRLFIFGISILAVVGLHSPVNVNIKIISYLKNYLYFGVDFFVFLSGMGLYISLGKNTISQYARNRMVRILPVYYPFIIIWIIYKVIKSNITCFEIVGNLTLIGWYVNLPNQFNWYIQGLLLLYVIAPIIYRMIRGCNTIKSIMIVFVAFIISFLFFNKELLLLFSRIPLFVLGFIAMEILTTRHQIYVQKIIAFMFICSIVLVFCQRCRPDLMWDYGMYWYPFIGIVPGGVILLSLLGEMFKSKMLPVYILICNVGKYSLEIYLVHIFVFELVREYIYNLNNMVGICYTIASIFLGYFYGRLIDSVRLDKSKLKV